MHEPLLTHVHAIASAFLDSLNERPVKPRASFRELVMALGGPVPEAPRDATEVVDELARIVEPGLMPTPGPRYFGFVTGGSVPAALGADWLASAWDQNVALQIMSPAMAAVEEVAARWVLDLLRLPAAASVGFVTGATMANVTAMAAARHEVLRRAGWDVEAHGLQGAPRVTVVAGAEAHSSIQQASRFVGLGASTIVRVAADDQGRMRPDALREILAHIDGPTIVCAQAGNVNTGAFDPCAAIARASHERGAWLHVDGAFGLWAAVTPSRQHLLDGVELADSWTVDAHKWLNVPYDSGLVVIAHPAAHRAAMSQTAEYLTRATGEERDGMDYTPEASRRARALAVYAAIRSLGRQGLDELVARCCRCAVLMADHLRAQAGVVVLNDVVLNQVLVRFNAPDGRNVTPAVIALVQQGGVCWAGGTRWNGEPAMRISVSGWRTTEADIDRSAAAILDSHAACSAFTSSP
jgi:glutamate/tyrosine decarboxylase-like PLP-dependent enzyme